MAFEQIISERRGRVGIIRLNRPERLNAWTERMHAEMTQQVEAWNADPDIGAFVISGEGRAFCAGADLGGFNQRLEEDDTIGPPAGGAPRLSHPWPVLLARSKPSVAAINGYAIGVGLTMVLPCDLRIASENAKLSIRFVKVGLVPELASTRLLAQHIGLGNATDMCLSGRMVEAAEAHHMGLVGAVTKPEELMETAIARAEELANNPTDVVMVIKDLLARNPLDPSLDSVMEREGMRDRMVRKWPSHREAVKAFLEKREPQFNVRG